MSKQNLAQWRATRREELDLPSGLHVTLQRVSMTDLLAMGKLPKTLFAEIQAAAKPTVTDAANTGALAARVDLQAFEKFPEFAELLEAITRTCVVDPPLADVSDDDHLAIGEIPFDDRMAIFNWANAGAKAIAPFSGEQRDDLLTLDAMGQRYSQRPSSWLGHRRRMAGVSGRSLHRRPCVSRRRGTVNDWRDDWEVCKNAVLGRSVGLR